MSLQCLAELNGAQTRLDDAVDNLGDRYERLLEAIDKATDAVEERIKDVAEAVETEVDQLKEWMNDEAEQTLPEAGDELRSSLEQTVTDAVSTCEQSLDDTIRQTSEAFDTVADEIQERVDKATHALIESGSTQLAGFQANVERRIVRHCEGQARELSEDALKDLAASAALDVTVSQLSVTLSASMSTALPYLIAAKAALGSIRRAMELIR